MSTDTTIESRDYKGYTIGIHSDLTPTNPHTDWDNPTSFVFSHRRYNLPNDADICFDDYTGWKEIADVLYKEHGALRVLPVYMIDHGNVALSTGAFGDPWDSGQLGLVYITQAMWVACMGEPYNGRSSKDRKLADEVMASDVKVYGQYLNGEVYGYVAVSPTGREVGSCWGFLGFDDFEELYDQAQAQVEWDIDQQSKLLVFS